MFSYVSQVVRKTWVLSEMEVRKLLHDPTELVTRSLQPILWLGIFGQALSASRVIPTAGYTYLQFLVPGILTQSVVFIAVFYGLFVIMDRDTGVLLKLLASPTPRLALVWGKMIAAGIRGLTQAVVVPLFGMLLGAQMHLGVLTGLGVALVVMLGAACFTGFSMIVASLVKTQERMMGIGQLFTLPLFFASNAIYPISIMPPWLQAVAYFNPLSYMVDALRTLMLDGTFTVAVGNDLLVLAGVAALVSVVSAKLYPRVIA